MENDQFCCQRSKLSFKFNEKKERRNFRYRSVLSILDLTSSQSFLCGCYSQASFIKKNTRVKWSQESMVFHLNPKVLFPYNRILEFLNVFTKTDQFAKIKNGSTHPQSTFYGHLRSHDSPFYT